MKYVIDHDLHIHSQISPCSNDPLQNKESIFAYGKRLGLKLLCVTDHFWDLNIDFQGYPGWVDVGNEKLKSILPLPQDKQCRFLMGAEVDMNAAEILGIDNTLLKELDFCILSLGHLWLKGFTVPADIPPLDPQTKKAIYQKRLLLLLRRNDLDFRKIGLGHFTTGFEKEALALFTNEEYKEIFSLAAQKGVGVELNFNSYTEDTETLAEIVRPYQIAKEVGCKFYLASDAHHPANFIGAYKKFQGMINALDLQEDNKWDFVKKQINILQTN